MPQPLRYRGRSRWTHSRHPSRMPGLEKAMSTRKRPSARRSQSSPPQSLAALAKAHGSHTASAKKATLKGPFPASHSVGGPLPRWYSIAVPVLFGLGGILMVIGGWAIGAVVYMNRVTPQVAEDINYPLLRFSTDVPGSDIGGYDPQSRMVAMAMLACIPVALLMGGMVIFLRHHMTNIRHARAE